MYMYLKKNPSLIKKELQKTSLTNKLKIKMIELAKGGPKPTTTLVKRVGTLMESFYRLIRPTSLWRTLL